jgi:hypothetical protein
MGAGGQVYREPREDCTLESMSPYTAPTTYAFLAP